LDAPHHAVITGGSRGIGRAIALALARTMMCGHRQLCAQHRCGGGSGRADTCGGTAHAVQGDVSNPDDVAGLVKQAREAFGPIAILVNNAGIGRPSPVFDNTLADFDATFAANVRSAFLVTQAVLPDMRDLNFGRLIFLWSAAAMTGGVISTAYASSKAAVVGMMHHYAASLAPWNITANAISPAFIETDIFAGIELPPAESPPLGRMGRSCRGCSDDRQLRIYDRPDDPGERWPIHDLRQRLGRTAALGAVGTVQRLRQAGRNTSKSISSLGLDRPLPRA
jgi:3-oxoacyl-[acyl-carrier protein] reductase